MPPHRLTVKKIELYPMDLPVKDPFTVASGQMLATETLFVRVILEDGHVGYGEIAPFYGISGENRDSSLMAARKLAAYLLGKRADHYRKLANTFKEMALDNPAARCGLEMALLDALCHSLSIPLWGLWGGADVRPRETDITIPITDAEHTLRLAHHWYKQGFRIFKMKVGRDADQDIQRLELLHGTFPDITFIVDPNQGFSRVQAIAFIKGVERIGVTIVLYEQPLCREDLEGQAQLRQMLNVPIAADESVRTVEDLQIILRHQAADYVNIKIMKSGVIQSMDIALTARSAGLGLMIGGMVETRLAMGCSFSFVLGLGGIEVLDLDTPLLLTEDPLNGGYRYRGPNLQPWETEGLGVTMAWKESSHVIEIE